MGRRITINEAGSGPTLFSTCPESRDLDGPAYLRRVADVARWSEAVGCEGILVYTENGLVDPWLVSQLIIQATERISPLVAVQPAYMHPYSVAKMVASLAHLHDRRLYLNLVAGGFRNDLEALGDPTPHDERYRRVVEYATIIAGLTAGKNVTLDGVHYTVKNLRLAPPVQPALRPGLMVSGSSEAGMATAAALGATAVRYPQPPDEEVQASTSELAMGIRVGVIAREDADQAWQIARARFPEDRVGQVAHRMATRVSDSQWHHQLAGLDGSLPDPGEVYWLGPFQNYAAFSPYLVGDYRAVATELKRYLDRGFSTFILDIPDDEEDLRHAAHVFSLAAGAA